MLQTNDGTGEHDDQQQQDDDATGAQPPEAGRTSDDGYDQVKVGLEVERLQSVPENLSSRQRRMYYDTSHVGNSAAGHTFPDVLDAEEKMAVIEYLKTL